MAKKKKKTQLSSEGKTELAKAIAEKSRTFKKTYANFEINISKLFRWMSGWLDKLLFNQKHGKVIALILAILFYITLNSDAKNIFDKVDNAENLGTVEISPVISDQFYEVEGMPKTVDVTIVGDLTDIKRVKQQKNFKIMANMADMGEGTHEVKFTTDAIPSRVKVLIQPSSAMVTIKKKSSRRFTVGYDFVNRNLMDSIYDLGEPTLEQGEVLVRASTETLNKIAFVKALIKVDATIKSDFETKAEVVAYDADGSKMAVDIIPGTLKANVKVTKPKKEVPITLNPTGIIPDGKAIESYTLNYDKVTVYAKQSVLDSISEIPITIPASTLTSDREISMPIIMPNGVTKISENIVNISIKLGTLEERTINNVPIRMMNGIDGFTYSIAGGQSNTVSVTIKGSKNVIANIRMEDIHVYADVSKFDKEGTVEMSLKVEGKNKLVTYELTGDNAKLKITAIGSVKKE